MDLSDYLRASEAVLAAMRRETALREVVERSIEIISDALSHDTPLLTCGNGGSASDALHVAAELVGRFARRRRALNCICLSANPAVLTAWSNDYSFETVFARQVEAYGSRGGVLLGISTSGHSRNVVRAFEVARTMNLTTIGLTGEGGGSVGELSDLLIAVPSRDTPLIQQAHTCIYHYVCDRIEEKLSSSDPE